jgi:hypothetical protein
VIGYDIFLDDLTDTQIDVGRDAPIEAQFCLARLPSLLDGRLVEEGPSRVVHELERAVADEHDGRNMGLQDVGGTGDIRFGHFHQPTTSVASFAET